MLLSLIIRSFRIVFIVLQPWCYVSLFAALTSSGLSFMVQLLCGSFYFRSMYGPYHICVPLRFICMYIHFNFKLVDCKYTQFYSNPIRVLLFLYSASPSPIPGHRLPASLSLYLSLCMLVVSLYVCIYVRISCF